MYQVQATVTKITPIGETQITVQIPTFFLDRNIQGIASGNHCERIVEKMLNPFGDSNIIVSCSVRLIRG